MTHAPPTILYRSASIVAVDKPAGLAVHRGQARDAVHALGLVRDAVGAYVYPVHRLDRGTSGVLVFALSPAAARRVGTELQRRAVEKRYVALVRGAPPDRVRVDHPLAQEGGQLPPQPACTEFVTLARYGRYALVEASPETGRTHQIRRHLKHLSCPIIGDVRYGKGEHNRWFRNTYGFSRLALHAERMSLDDPATNQRVTIRAPLPLPFVAVLEALARDAASGRATGPAPRI